MVPARRSRRPAWSIAAAMLCGAVIAGCQTLPALVPCPMPAVEQSARIEKLVPIGTPREEAVARLKKAGIDGTFSTGNSVFYCDTWKQNDEERWHINVELLFNESGEVYAYRPDPSRNAAGFSNEAGAAKVAKQPKENVAKQPKEVAEGPKSTIVDPFAE